MKPISDENLLYSIKNMKNVEKKYISQNFTNQKE
jgi:hypothetical protein